MEDREPLSDQEIAEILDKVDAGALDPRGVKRLVAELRVWKGLVASETEYAREYRLWAIRLADAVKKLEEALRYTLKYIASSPPRQDKSDALARITQALSELPRAWEK
jgi:hypothetical protein